MPKTNRLKFFWSNFLPGPNNVYKIYDRQIVILNNEVKEGFSASGSSVKTEATAQQQNVVSGTVIDAEGIALPGVTILIKGTSRGTVTGPNGDYSLSNVPADATLLFSFIGMRSQEVQVGNRNSIDITMEIDAIGLEEVIAVGYGTQKRVNLTGSVSNVDVSNIESRAVTQSSQMLAGKVSGVTVTQPSGQPGRNESSIVIRGLGTFSSAGTQPLVLVDGLASSIDNVNPNDIESISVLKDAASASIYGTRAANGVILIQTKRGTRAGFNISYNGYAGWKKVNELPENVNSWEHAMLTNEARNNVGQGNTYSQEEIEKFRNGTEPENYPNVNHLEDLLSTGSGFQTNHNLSFSSSSDKNSYLFSIGYLDENGLVAKTNYKRYSFLFNFDSDITDNLKMAVNINGNKSSINEPMRNLSTNNVASLIAYAQQVPNIIGDRNSDGTYDHWHDYGITAIMDNNNFTRANDGFFLGSINLDWELFNDFILTGKLGYNYENTSRDSYQSIIRYDDVYTYGPNALSVVASDNSLITMQALANYDLTLNENNFHFLAGFSQEEFRYDFIDAYRDNFPNDLLYELNAGSAANMRNSGTASEWALRSFFGRVNYSYAGKYLLEGNVRYDGTSRFPEDNRWAIFPSFSAGWRISEESFIGDNYSWIDNLKLRASWGILGNQNIGNYPYQRLITLGKDYPFGGVRYPGAYMAAIANREIEWEKTEMTNVGLDFTILNNKLDFVIDYFNKYTSGILYNISVSRVLGMGSSEVNAGEVKNTGFEILASYNETIGGFRFNITPNLSIIRNEVMKIANAEVDINQGLFVGEPLGAIYGYVADGLFVDETDIEEYPSQPYGVDPGFIRYKDISGPEGVPDGQVDPEYDRTVIGTAFPKINYGLNVGASYANFDFSVQFQGVAGNENYLPGSYQQTAFVNGGTAQRWQMENRWTQENPDRNSTYPLMLIGSNNGLRFISTYWLRDAGFLQVKNIQLGYNFPAELLSSIGIQSSRIYISGENIYRFDNYYPGWDPEMGSGGGNGQFYPNTATYSIGMRVNF
jgi:TonB-dependent starch-binding outer membrane protein SusC